MKIIEDILDGIRNSARLFTDLPLWLQAIWLLAAVSTVAAIVG